MSFVVFFASLALGGMIGSAFFPDTDRGEFFLNIDAPVGSSIEQTDQVCKQAESILVKRPEITSMLTTIGGENVAVNKAQIFVKMLKKDERNKNVKQIMDELRSELKVIPGIQLDSELKAVRAEMISRLHTASEVKT